MKHTVKDVLHMAGHLLADPKRHVRTDMARNARGDVVTVCAPDACRWCLWGALIASARMLKTRAVTVSDVGLTIRDWDSANENERLAIAAKLRSA